jgi:hypothetical protein
VWKETLKHLGGITGAFLLGLVAWYLLEIRAHSAGHHEKILAAFIAICVAALFEVGWLLGLDLHHSKKEAAKVRGTLRGIEESTSSLLKNIADRVERYENLSEVLRHERGGLTREELRERWLYLLCRLRLSYVATNYIEHIYETNWARAALLIQNAKKAESGVGIGKVFLIDHEAELLRLSEHIEEQKRIQADVHYMLYDAVRKDHVLAKQLNEHEIPSIDFGIFDDEIVLVWDLDGREIRGGRVLFGASHVERHSTFFNALASKAKEFSRGRFVVLPIPVSSLELFVRRVANWPSYDALYHEMDYALRRQTGWLDTFAFNPHCQVLAAFAGGVLVGFSLLVGNGKDDAELYVAIHPSHLRHSYGALLTKETLSRGFRESRLRRIHLKVRKNLEHRIRLYRTTGHFAECGQKTEKINGTPTEFIEMELLRDRYLSVFPARAAG